MKKIMISIIMTVAIATTFIACNMQVKKDEMAVARLNLVNVEGNLEDKIEINKKKDDHVWSSSGNGVHVFHGAEGFYDALEYIELTEYCVDDTHYVR